MPGPPCAQNNPKSCWEGSAPWRGCDVSHLEVPLGVNGWTVPGGQQYGQQYWYGQHPQQQQQMMMMMQAQLQMQLRQHQQLQLMQQANMQQQQQQGRWSTGDIVAGPSVSGYQPAYTTGHARHSTGDTTSVDPHPNTSGYGQPQFTYSSMLPMLSIAEQDTTTTVSSGAHDDGQQAATTSLKAARTEAESPSMPISVAKQSEEAVSPKAHGPSPLRRVHRQALEMFEAPPTHPEDVNSIKSHPIEDFAIEDIDTAGLSGAAPAADQSGIASVAKENVAERSDDATKAAQIGKVRTETVKAGTQRRTKPSEPAAATATSSNGRLHTVGFNLEAIVEESERSDASSASRLAALQKDFERSMHRRLATESNEIGMGMRRQRSDAGEYGTHARLSTENDGSARRNTHGGESGLPQPADIIIPARWTTNGTGREASVTGQHKYTGETLKLEIMRKQSQSEGRHVQDFVENHSSLFASEARPELCPVDFVARQDSWLLLR